jgi:photosystem II stability/assembly factor-like uncharacterized protein
VAGLSGVVLLSSDGGRSFSLVQQSDHGGLAAILALGRRLVALGENGARLIALPPASTGAAGAPR